jgi:hypothetical protein
MCTGSLVGVEVPLVGTQRHKQDPFYENILYLEGSVFSLSDPVMVVTPIITQSSYLKCDISLVKLAAGFTN